MCSRRWRGRGSRHPAVVNEEVVDERCTNTVVGFRTAGDDQSHSSPVRATTGSSPPSGTQLTTLAFLRRVSAPRRGRTVVTSVGRRRRATCESRPRSPGYSSVPRANGREWCGYVFERLTLCRHTQEHLSHSAHYHDTRPDQIGNEKSAMGVHEAPIDVRRSSTPARGSHTRGGFARKAHGEHGAPRSTSL